MGYYRAGFTDITGIDNRPMPRYPFKFIQADALEYLAEHGHEYDVIHASPPCQAYSLGAKRWDKEYPDLLPRVEMALLETGKPFVIENVIGAPFTLSTITLCGIQLGLNVIRHRRFVLLPQIKQFPHTIPHPKRGDFITCAGHGGNGSNKYSDWCKAMDIDWMTKTELTQAIPPAYTEYIGKQLIRAALASNGEIFQGDAQKAASLLMDEVEQNCEINRPEFGELFSGVMITADMMWRIVVLINRKMSIIDNFWF